MDLLLWTFNIYVLIWDSVGYGLLKTIREFGLSPGTFEEARDEFDFINMHLGPTSHLLFQAWVATSGGNFGIRNIAYVDRDFRRTL
ncbi:hypothetical protein Y032_0009g596 [Ancylostoma ceylanicum]|uniref:Uncharacterized protein n=1 Tax=Ancylostoma ceylanicum TaxID=53326 RepID=A0A016VJM4_9BILA|nr:hypothetical protein Y032_0009g596 [Ancylostoma ceylanicum]